MLPHVNTISDRISDTITNAVADTITDAITDTITDAIADTIADADSFKYSFLHACAHMHAVCHSSMLARLSFKDTAPMSKMRNMHALSRHTHNDAHV